ncbi:ester cyclase [Telmatospirillum siberiense]|uniref:Polyketide cyclase n=1 Tax=Telmatospirillum siberiense TaxID=382514 RepID=A0A2N3PQ12_9PROT|nr:nuclear transport factor 2 family protein [Telmatospirillum siberiense]PKU22490.1 polyketide cyclase [Telmatospirillum siberiense]
MNLVRTLIGFLPLILLSMPATSSQAEDLTAQESKNKNIVIDFYKKAIIEKDFEAAKKYFGDHYTQHNPLAPDGPDGLKGLVQILREKYPNSKTEIKRVFVDGDYVILHVHSTREPGDRGTAIVDIFRLENDKVVEHWDVIQPVPETAANKNSMF